MLTLAEAQEIIAQGEQAEIDDIVADSLGHSGNYKYVWVFSRAAAHHMPPPLFHFILRKEEQ